MPAYTNVILGCPQTISYELDTTDALSIDTATNPGFFRVVPNTPGAIATYTFVVKV